MPIDLLLPELGENITAGVVVKVLVKKGDDIAAGQPVIELETDKAVVEVPADRSGTVVAVHVGEGDEIRVGQKILTVEAAAGGDAPAPEDAGNRAAASTEGKDPPVDAAPPPADRPSAPAPPPADAHPSPAADGPAAPAAPSVRRFAREIGVDIHAVSGSGPGGRISAEDVKAHSRKRPDGAPPRATAAIGAGGPPSPDFTRWGEIDRRPMDGVRKTAAVHLGTAWATIPHVTHFDRADITQLEAFRKAHAPTAAAAGGRLTVTAILLKIVAGALRRFPAFNASVDMERREIVFKRYIHVGVAVDTDRGLLVPVIRDVDRKSIVALSVELATLAEKARNRKLTPDEMQGGTFTLSNLGGIGGTGFTPIVNAPEVAILGVSRSETVPVYRDDRFEPRLMIPMALSYDHRLIDGAEAARFLRWIARAVEQPLLLALE